jgi:hypothetical protein
LEKYYGQSIDLYDRIAEFNKTTDSPIMLAEYMRKGAAYEDEDIADDIKAKFLYRLVKEFRIGMEQ